MIFPLICSDFLKVPSLWCSCLQNLKVKENVFLLLNSIRARGGRGASRAAHWAPPWQSPLCWVYPPLSHTLIRLSFSLIETPPQWHSIRAAEWKPGYFLHILSPRLGRGPSKGINQCSLTALPSGNDLSLFCAQKWHFNLKMDMHKLYIQLLLLCFCAQAKEPQERRPAACK